jgi:hypothetical protein
LQPTGGGESAGQRGSFQAVTLLAAAFERFAPARDVIGEPPTTAWEQVARAAISAATREDALSIAVAAGA